MDRGPFCVKWFGMHHFDYLEINLKYIIYINILFVNLVFLNRFIKILLASVLMGIFFKYVIYFFNDKLLYEASFKAIYLIGAVILGLIFYLLIAILIKAFKRSDINLNY